MGVSLGTLFALMHGDQIPKDESLGRICRGLNLPKPEQDELVKLATLERAKSVTRVFLKELYDQVREKKAAAPPAAAKVVPVFNLEVASDSTPGGGGLFLGPPEGELSIPGLDPRKALACILNGDSLEPQYRDGDILIFNTAEEPQSGDVCFVVARNLSILGQVFFEGDDLRLVPVSPRWAECTLPRRDAEQLWRLLGVFTWHLGIKSQPPPS